MIILSKKRIQIVVVGIIVSLLAFSIQIGNRNNNITNTNESINTLETTSTPVSGKTVVLDAGHGVPDERSPKQ